MLFCCEDCFITSQTTTMLIRSRQVIWFANIFMKILTWESSRRNIRLREPLSLMKSLFNCSLRRCSLFKNRRKALFLMDFLVHWSRLLFCKIQACQSTSFSTLKYLMKWLWSEWLSDGFTFLQEELILMTIILLRNLVNSFSIAWISFLKLMMT